MTTKYWKSLNYIKNTYIPDYALGYGKTLIEQKTDEALSNLLDIVNKQSPRIIKAKTFRVHKCPDCKEELPVEVYGCSYCPWCGVKLDWRRNYETY